MHRFGLIGHPIAHSKSPELFTVAYNGKYQYDLIEGTDFEGSYARFMKEYHAINVTAPFKVNAFEKADIISGPAALTGAANILVKTDKGVSAHNSDFTGVILTVAEALFPGITAEFYATFGGDAHIKIHQFVKARLAEHYGKKPEALVVGLGGAGKAAAVAAAEMGYATTVMNRSAEKVEAFIKGLPEYGFKHASISGFRASLPSYDLVVYALPMALDEFSDLRAEDFSSGQLVLEANYKDPSFSGIVLARLMDGGAKYLPGRAWHINQAVSGYSIMTGETPDIGALLQVKYQSI